MYFEPSLNSYSAHGAAEVLYMTVVAPTFMRAGEQVVCLQFGCSIALDMDLCIEYFLCTNFEYI